MGKSHCIAAAFVVGILAVLGTMLVAAVQKVRIAAERTSDL
jgi:hypothetical protein